MLKSINKYLNLSILSSIVFLVLGVLMIAFPGTSVEVFSKVIALTSLIIGFILVLIDLKSSKAFMIFDTVLLGVVLIILGIIILIHPTILTSLIPFCLGIFYVVSGITRLRLSLTLKDASLWYLSLVSSLLSVFCGIYFISYPMTITNIITIISGIVIVIYSISSLYDVIYFKKNINKISGYFKANIITIEE